ncbi:type IV pilus modification protein PilV [Undibacterium sp. Ji67W]|uniref:type IV pilus modification protein PilV n=1 Tax=Undibacterium sp. Ji67W TaxID=3413042 RepID=UPI003BEFB0E8
MNRLLRSASKQKGFTLFEVVVAMIVCGIGLLGLAKMAALAVSTTQNAGSRSLIAVQMESLASMMHANRSFWQSGQILKFSATGTTVTDSKGILTGSYPAGCLTVCTPAQLAAFNVNTWVNDMNNQFPSYTATVNCSAPGTTVISGSAVAATAIDCSINVTWTEKQVAVNANAATGSAAQVTTQSYSVYLKP